MSAFSKKMTSYLLPNHRHFLLLVGVAVVLINLLVLSVHRGIGYGAALILICSVALLVFSFKRPPRPLEKNDKVLILGLVSLPLAVALSMLLHGDWIWSNLDKPLRFLLVIPVFLAIRHYGLHRNYLLIGAIGGAIAAGCFGYYQKYVLGMGVAHGFTHKIPFGDISLMLGMFSLAIFVPSKENRKVPIWLLVLAFVGFCFGLLGSICSGTRGGWVALPFLLWLVLSFSISSRLLRWLIYTVCLASLIGIYQGNALVNSQVDLAVDKTILYFEEGVAEGSAGSRLEMWRGAWNMFLEHPLMGVGKEGYRPEAERMKAEGLFNTDVYDHPHNDFLNLLAELGVMGGIAFVLLYGLFVYFFTRWRNTDPQLACLGLLLVFGYFDFSLTQAMFEHNISTSFLALNVAVIAGMLSHCYHSAPPKEAIRNPA
ncbi:MAG: O-antigen ligase family protein [Motiliproteus sp.]|nr:O-antigen ligase family protein [Motiliproteus sp.]MCW9053766.1 O-antigen ligase family protein [Motiliproteus sp.]